MSKIILPTYVTKLPSTGTKVTYRPFSVKEEKSLLLALQEDSLETVIEAIKNVIIACTNNKLNPEEIPYYDSEFLFLQIRSKSVGEIIDMVGSCSCSQDAKTEFSIDISDIVISPEPVKQTGMRVVDTPYTITLRHPSIEDFSNSFNITDTSSAAVVARCITSIYTDDEVCSWTFDEKLDFVESMSPKQQKPISEFLRNMPMVQLPTSYTCNKCGLEHKSFLTGFQNFFV